MRKSTEYLYTKLADILREQITSGVFQPGEYIMSENELSQHYRLSRISVRKALDLLEKDDLIVRKVGQGTMVSPSYTPMPKKDKTIRIAAVSPSYYADIALPLLCQRFESEHPGIQIVLSELSLETYWKSVEHASRTGHEYDLLFITDRQFNELEHVDFLTEMDKLVRGSSPLLYQEPLQAYKRGDRLYGVPITFSPILMVYNPKLLDAYAVSRPSSPWTADEFLAICRQLSVDANGDGITDTYGLALSSGHTRWTVLALQNGVDFPSLQLDAASLLKPLSLIHRLLYKERTAFYQPSSMLALLEPFLNEQVAFALTSVMEMAAWQRAQPDFEPQVVPLPFGEIPATIHVANGIVMPQVCRDPELCASFVEFALRPDMQEQLLRQFGFLSVLRPINDQSLAGTALWEHYLSEAMLKNSRYAHHLFPKPGMTELFDKEMTAFWFGLESAESFVRRIPELLHGLEKPN